MTRSYTRCMEASRRSRRRTRACNRSGPCRTGTLPASSSEGRHRMNRSITAALALCALALATHAAAQVTFYEGEGFRGRVFRTDKPVANLQRHGFNDRASSAIVERGRWQVCEDAAFRGRCIVLREGSYDSLAAMGLGDRISSVRPAANGRRYENEAPAAMPGPDYEYRRRPNERLYEATVLSAHAVGGPPEHRCWVE